MSKKKTHQSDEALVSSSVKLSATVHQVDPQKLKPHPRNNEIFGKYFREELMLDIHTSVKEVGILEPIIVAADQTTIVSGHKRHMVAKMLNLKTVPVRYIESKISEEQLLDLMVVVNTARMNVSKADRLALYHDIIPAFEERLAVSGKQNSAGGYKLTPKEIAKKTGIDVSLVSADLTRLKSQQRAKSMHATSTHKGEHRANIMQSIGHMEKVIKLLAISNPDTRKRIFEYVDKFNKVSTDIRTGKRWGKTPSEAELNNSFLKNSK